MHNPKFSCTLSMTLGRLGILIGLFIFLGGSNGWAQLQNISNMVQTPTPGAGHDYIKLLSETVTPSNGQVSIRINVPMPPGRGITIPFSFAYDSGSVMEMQQVRGGGQEGAPVSGQAHWVATRRWLSQGGWSYTVPMVTAVPGSLPSKYQSGSVCNFISNFMFEDATGGQHALYLSPTMTDDGNSGDAQVCDDSYPFIPHSVLNNTTSTGQQSAFTSYGDYYQATTPNGGSYGFLNFAPVTLVDADGTIYQSSAGNSIVAGNYAGPITSIADRNGNGISIGGSTQTEGLFTYTDLSGTRTLLSSSGFGTVGGTGDTMTVSGLSQPYHIIWKTITANFPLSVYEEYPETDSQQYWYGSPTSYPGCQGLLPMQWTINVVSEIDLPNGQKYTFTYDVDHYGNTTLNPNNTQFGVVDSITFPDGGSVAYQWEVGPRSEYVNYMDAMAKGAGNQIGVGGCGATYAVPTVAQRTVYDGAHSSGVLIQTFTYATNPTPFSAMTWSSKNATVKSYDLIRNPSSLPPSGSTYDITQYTYGYVVAPQQPNATSQPSPQIAVETQVIKGTASNPDQATTNELWWHPSNYVTPVSLLACEDTTLPGGQSTMTYHFYGPSAQYWLPGAAAQETETDEFGYGSLCGSTLPTYGSLPSGLIRQTERTFGNTFPNYTAYQYYSLPVGSPAVATQSIFDKPTVATVGPDSTPADIVSKTEYTSYDNLANLLAMQRDCLNSYCSNALTYGATYDSYGNLATTTDAGSQITTYKFNSCTGAYLGEIDYPATGSVSHEVKFNYDCPSGSVTSSTDQNSNTTDYSYTVSGNPEPLGRLTGITYPDGGATAITYNDTAPTPSIVTTKTNTTNIETTTVMNGLGQVTETQVNSDPQGTMKTDTIYDGQSRIYEVSNPYYSGTPGYTTTNYEEATDRVNQTIYADTSQSTTTWMVLNSLDCSQVTDAASKVRNLCNNSYGQLASVTEDPNGLNYSTTYGYNILNDLTGVTQGSQTRTFYYDSFSRLRYATNPESGTTQYTYGEGSAYCGGDRTGACQRVDANGHTTYYTYDADNRLTNKTYSDTSTMRACYYYDGQSSWGNTMVNPIGHLTTSYGVTSAGAVVSGAESFQWDAMGRLQGQVQCTPSSCSSSKGYPVYSTYDLLGNATSAWDSSVAVYSGYDGANRLNSVTAGLGVNAETPGPGSQPILSASSFSPFGGLTAATVGSSLSETRAYNPNRGWLGSVLVKNGSTQLYSLSGPSSGLINYAGNGNVLGLIDSVNGTWTYAYDGVNRLNTAVATGHSFAYTDDRYGNMTCVDNGSSHSACTPTGLTFNAANNRINSTGYTYDSNGNLLTNNALTRALVYDTENRITCVQGTDGTCTSSTATIYSYDPNGQRIAKSTGAGTLIEEYVYDLGGNQVSAHNSTGVLRNELYDPDGRHEATYSASVLTYNFADWMGTDRFQFNSGCTASFTDTPYGMNLAGTPCDSSPMHFTDKQRDTETSFDYFGARYYGSPMGRWLSPDWAGAPASVPYADFGNPQSLNLYGYVGNNPLSHIDDDGHAIIYITSGPSALQNEQTVRDSVTALLANPDTNGYLQQFVGTKPGTPDLVIDNGDLHALDSSTVKPDGTPGTSITQATTDPNITTDDQSGGPIITLDNRTTADQTPGVLTHEIVHAGESQKDPAKFKKDSIEEQKNPCHDCRPQEQRANAVQNAQGPAIAAAVKNIQKQRKEAQKQAKKAARKEQKKKPK